MSAVVTAEDVETIATEVWESVVAGAVDATAAGVDGPLAVGAVAISGAWQGWVTLELPAAAAERAAAAMLGHAAGDRPEPEDVADALGELANMIGGNVKSLVPAPSTLGLPVVVGDPLTVVREGQEICRAELSRDGADLCVRVWQAPAGPTHHQGREGS